MSDKPQVNQSQPQATSAEGPKPHDPEVCGCGSDYQYCPYAAPSQPDGEQEYESTTIIHSGFFADRLELDNPREKAFAEQWKQENDRHQVLQHLLVKTDGSPFAIPFDSTKLAEYKQETAS